MPAKDNCPSVRHRIAPCSLYRSSCHVFIAMIWQSAPSLHVDRGVPPLHCGCVEHRDPHCTDILLPWMRPDTLPTMFFPSSNLLIPCLCTCYKLDGPKLWLSHTVCINGISIIPLDQPASFCRWSIKVLSNPCLSYLMIPVKHNTQAPTMLFRQCSYNVL